MYKAINEFSELWNTLLAKPINWEYSGKGLPEKAVKRFIKMLNSDETMDVRFLVKQLKLIVNIIKDYWKEIPDLTWNNLNNILNEKYEAMKTNIISANSKKNKENQRLECLDYLIPLINNKVKNLCKMVA